MTRNCTYIQNPGYSSVYTTSGSCSYSVTPISTSICQLRLDFEKFVTAIGTTGACTDSFVVTGPSNSNGVNNNLCGTLTGQHGELTYFHIIRVVYEGESRLISQMFNFGIKFIQSNQDNANPFC